MSGKDEYNLLPKQRLFADYYLGGMFAGQALRAAGYRDSKPDKGAHKMLQRPEIREYLRIQRQDLAEKASIQREQVIEWLTRVILTPIGRAGEHHRELLESDYHHTHADGRTTRRIRMVSKMAAVRLLCHMMGWTHPANQDDHQHSELAEMIRKARAGEK